MNPKKMNKGLTSLRQKYGAAKGEIERSTAHCFVGATLACRGAWSARSSSLRK